MMNTESKNFQEKMIDILSYRKLRNSCYDSVKKKCRSEIWPKKAGKNKLLYHYTDTIGLMGIINKGELWLTDSRFLNDKSEVLYGRTKVYYWLNNINYKINEISDPKKQIFTEIKQKLIDYFHNKIKKAQSDEKELLNEENDDEVYFISCFCDDNDSLNQWQGYTDKNGGYAIGFQAEKLASFTKKYNRSIQATDQLNKYRRCYTNVIYEPKESDISNPDSSLLRPLIYEMIDWLYHQILESNDNEYTKKKELLFQAVLSNLNLIAIVTKNAKFYAEKEWRICYGGVAFKDFDLLDFIDFRPTRFGLSPYLKLSLNTPSVSNQLFIQEIVAGPSNWMFAKKNALKNFLHKNKLYDINVNESEIPIRM